MQLRPKPSFPVWLTFANVPAEVVLGAPVTRDAIWSDDLLGFEDLAETYTRLITTLSEASTISIEAGFGRGKTFFRENWAAQLSADGALVVELDAQTSDHSGDPVVTFLGALLREVPRQDPTRWKRTVAVAKRIGLAGAKTATKAVLREGADEISDLLAGDEEGARADMLDHISDDTAKSLSKAASDLIDKQLAAEAARDEIAGNLNKLHAALTEGRETDKVIVFIDELDRCHPDYALALLEAMKLVFAHPGFVFVLFVNPEYLERLAAHRFGAQDEGEKYLDKFIDMRLGLPVNDEQLSKAVEHLFSDLPVAIPFGDHEEFSVARGARLAGELAPVSGLSMRQIKAVLFKVRMACAVYKERPIDVALLVWLGFREGGKNDAFSIYRIGELSFRRGFLTPFLAERLKQAASFRMPSGEHVTDPDGINEWLVSEYLTLASLPVERFIQFQRDSHRNSKSWDDILFGLAPHYIPDHEAMLASVHKFAAPGST